MKTFSRSSLQQVGVEGALITLAPAPFILASALVVSGGTPPLWRLAAATIAALSCLAAALLLLRSPRLGRICVGLALGGSVVAIMPYLASGPFAALLGSVATISLVFVLTDYRVRVNRQQRSTHVDRCLQRARWSAMSVPALVAVALLVDPARHVLADGMLTMSAVMAQILAIHWLWVGSTRRRGMIWIILSAIITGILLFSFINGQARLFAFVASVLTSLVLPGTILVQEDRGHWWETLLNHPARVLLSTFLALCIMGTLLLLSPGAARLEVIALVDAAFTAVSAVCVTGLTVMDTTRDFTLLGQGFILLLIQLGGLGIMTITTVALHAMGRRLSLRQERLLTTLTDTDHQDLLALLITIVRFTFIAEGLGALILAGLFYAAGDQAWPAVWRGIFTAVSAFCNAGFALQSNNLISYQNNPLILHAVAALIVFGGLAPAASLLVPRWLAGRPVSIAARLALVTTTVLLISGAFLFLVFEWSGALANLTVANKIHNAWFLSVTCRTAGFNSVEINGVAGSTFLVMICLMFIGGSPGGTAGGVKTTTIGVLAMTFWASSTGRAEVAVWNRRITPGTINRAITIVAAGAFVWFVSVMMLEITQQISARNIIFEATSALGTVGLSTGATGQLDGIGKVIIMITMFIGRIGPITLFMLLSEDHSTAVARCPATRINFT